MTESCAAVATSIVVAHSSKMHAANNNTTHKQQTSVDATNHTPPFFTFFLIPSCTPPSLSPPPAVCAAAAAATDAAPVVLSEVYENQRYKLAKWGDPGCGRYTDVTRKKRQPLDQVLLPPGWEWTTDWELSPEIVEFDPLAAVDSTTEEIWENQRLIPFKVVSQSTMQP